MLLGSCDYARYFLPVMFASRGATIQEGLQCRSGLFHPGGGARCDRHAEKAARLDHVCCSLPPRACPNFDGIVGVLAVVATFSDQRLSEHGARAVSL
eukprot:5072923-Pyramimonas_sp.AAC.1